MTSGERASDLLRELGGLTGPEERWAAAMRHLNAEAQDAIDAEREACARLAADFAADTRWSLNFPVSLKPYVARAAEGIAAAVRARGS